MSGIEASGLRYEVGGATLIDDVDLAVDAGELVAVAGPNGAGKTTLLRLLAGDLAPTRGGARIGGLAVRDMTRAELAGERAFLGQGRTLGNPFSVEDVVAMGGWARSVAPGEVDSAMEVMDIEHLRGRTVGSLSSGEHTRVELARILVQDAAVLLLDEPLTALDIAHQERVMTHLKTLAGEGRSVVTALHDLNAAAAHSHRVIMLDHGRVRAAGPPDQVLVAGLLTEVYGVEMAVHRVGGRTMVLPAD